MFNRLRDRRNLEEELKKAIGKQRLMFANYPYDERLSVANCIRMSAAMKIMLGRAGINGWVGQNFPYKGGNYPGFSQTYEHRVYIAEQGDKKTLIDGVWTKGYSRVSGFFPQEKILVVEDEKKQEIFRKMANSCVARDVQLSSNPRDPLPISPLFEGLNHNQRLSVVELMWDPENFQPVEPNEDVWEMADDLAKRVSDEAIENFIQTRLLGTLAMSSS